MSATAFSAAAFLSAAFCVSSAFFCASRSLAAAFGSGFGAGALTSGAPGAFDAAGAGVAGLVVTAAEAVGAVVTRADASGAGFAGAGAEAAAGAGVDGADGSGSGLPDGLAPGRVVGGKTGEPTYGAGCGIVLLGAPRYGSTAAGRPADTPVAPRRMITGVIITTSSVWFF